VILTFSYRFSEDYMGAQKDKQKSFVVSLFVTLFQTTDTL